VAALEMAAVLPLLSILLLGTINLGTGIQQTLRLSAAARAGGYIAASSPTDMARITAAIRTSLPASWTDVVVAPPAMTCLCPDTASTTCGTACASGEQRFITVAVTRPFDSVLLPQIATLRGDMVMRLQ
jgi:Flp pilus assembly protein TadG